MTAYTSERKSIAIKKAWTDPETRARILAGRERSIKAGTWRKPIDPEVRRVRRCATQNRWIARNYPMIRRRRIAYATTARLKQRALIIKLKSKRCADCHHRFPWYVMDFDHVRGKKLFDMSRLMAKVIAVQRVLAEAAKCDVVCSNCHRIRTWKKWGRK